MRPSFREKPSDSLVVESFFAKTSLPLLPKICEDDRNTSSMGVYVKSKGGLTIPAQLRKAIAGDMALRNAWGLLRPSCQRQYADIVQTATEPATAVKRVARLAFAYAKKHPRPFFPR